ncbi:putative glycine dehydrogenase [decarboxylating] subunit 2 [Piscirickettsia salmonis]|uniref:aminomethyl-transferring glycine dehydrogenase subunit GcvPB n=1 Tax=Piscirickettsia salmonis TaxID=1238 RepID=UPI0012B82346|nr:aminomethyl-transferring glycine dehydrogenase subunit GcvPB [Piscirickettsia salmonis]QGP51152.1 putative glycine dehydrogenase [decarboxylating] subunit 2 [Piscirickettsia salmonis]QGP53680.1 putative glycine dehydrogenase [decarboxylating] subunit 2 [Piscirickettsia salmonis]QGP60413.1 putative glycine dehydrogenase [decarboxylating] subunit 2 [Piscirickettsia salmonis]QGP63246.1 putative glycine dehydrogenase [decarboxylating] subunit 2 [Piscirickettsia salmonis]
MLIFERSATGRTATAQAPREIESVQFAEQHRRKDQPVLPEVSEMQVVRHYTQLSQKNFSIDSQFYPLGSCTMKYNPRGAHKAASLEGFLNRHPYLADQDNQGFLSCMHELQEMLAEMTGMSAVALSPMAGAQGEYAGVAMIRAYHLDNGDYERDEILVPDAAHGTNPASAVMCGFKVKEIPTTRDGDVDIDALKAMVGAKTAGIMLTNPSTLGVFERKIKEIAAIVHQAGGLLYYDGANLNAILGQTRPGDMGFDVIHLNLHKTFATPHGGGGPGAGPVAVSERLKPYLPIPYVQKQTKSNRTEYCLVDRKAAPKSIGRMSTFMGNSGVLLRAYVYIRLLGKSGVEEVSRYATLSANYLMARLAQAGFTMAYPGRRATHEFILTLAAEKKSIGVSAMDVAKRLLDYGMHAPTTYFPLLVPECFLIEPTETESKEELDAFVDAMVNIRAEAVKNPEFLHAAPYTLPVRRLDDVKAVKELDIAWQQGVDNK